ncbi:MAG: T9SS type A sorting domain-containing protein [Calditrichota bacterium]
MRRLVSIFTVMLLLGTSVIGWASDFYADGPNAPQLNDLYSQMEEMKVTDEYDQVVWDQFHDLLGLGGDRSGGNLDQGGNTQATATPITALPYDVTGTTCGYDNTYDPYCSGSSSHGSDVVYSFTPAYSMWVDISLCDPYTDFDTKLYVYRDNISSGNRIACDDNSCPGSDASLLQEVSLSGGTTYYIVVDGYGYGTCGNYRLQVRLHQWSECDYVADGTTDNGDNTFTYRQTTNANSPAPYYEGPFSHPNSECNQTISGFNIYSWFDGDYGWKHYWSDWNNSNLNIQSVRVIICAWDVDEHTCNIENPGNPQACELDNIFADGNLLNPEWLSGDNNIWQSTVFDVAPASLLDDGWLNMFMDIDVWNDECNWATTLRWAQLVVVYSIEEEENNPPYTPTGRSYPDCADETTEQCVVVLGPNPADPDGDIVTYQYRWFVKNSTTGGGFVDDENNSLFPFNHTGSCVPADHSFAGDQWRVEVYAVDDEGAISVEPWIVTFPEVIFDCGQPWPYTEIDMGDLATCNYPTLVNNPGHGISGIAWLGQNISGEAAPNTLDLDLFDDGVVPVGNVWVPCEVETVTVTVTAGQFYGDYLEENGQLYLNAWKDGNLDGDFCDRFQCPDGGVTDEWIIHDMLVTPGTFNVAFLDPGIIEYGMPRYDAVCRFRLTSTPVGRYGFGLIDTASCPAMNCGQFAADFLGEVEDYIWTDLQLDVELGNFDAIGGSDQIALHWTTRSELGNNRFDIYRDGTKVGEVASLGDSPTGHSYEWVDRNVVTGVSYEYSLNSVSLNGAVATLATVSATLTDLPGTVTEYALHQNYPNPFNPLTTIAFDLKDAGFVSLKVYNLNGQEVATLVNGTMSAGAKTVQFSASNLPSGVYWYKLETNGFSAARKMMLMK